MKFTPLLSALTKLTEATSKTVHLTPEEATALLAYIMAFVLTLWQGIGIKTRRLVMKIGDKVQFMFQGKWKIDDVTPNIGTVQKVNDGEVVVTAGGGARYYLSPDMVRPVESTSQRLVRTLSKV